jgi:hypothetical protein
LKACVRRRGSYVENYINRKDAKARRIGKNLCEQKKKVKANLCDLASLRAKGKSKSKPLRRSVFAVKRKEIKSSLCGVASLR